MSVPYEMKMFPGWLRAARAEHGLTQQQAAVLLGVAIRSYQSWEAGEHFPSELQLAAIIWEFGIPPFPTKGMGYFLYPSPDVQRSNGLRHPTATERPKVRQMA